MTKKSVNKKDIDIKKIVFEIIAIPLCLMYLYYVLLGNHPKMNIAVLYVVTLITCGEFFFKYVQEVYIYESKNNLLKVLVIILCILLILALVTYIFIRTEFVRISLLILLLFMSGYLLYFAVKNIISIIKDKNNFAKYVIPAYLSLASFVMMVMGSIIFLIKGV